MVKMDFESLWLRGVIFLERVIGRPDKVPLMQKNYSLKEEYVM